jgi:uncharacterized protein YndB with AHSA1/START domain
MPANAAETKSELVMSRTFKAPRSLVFEAWTTAEHVARWFTPRPLTTSACTVDFRPGGAFRVVMRMPDGLEHPFEGSYTDIVKDERIVFVGRIHGEVDVETTVTFKDAGNDTVVDVKQTYSKETENTRGAHAGWTATLDQLGEHIAR